MKQLIIFLCCILFFVAAQGQIPVAIDSLYNLIKQNNINSKNADWKAIDEGFAKKIELATNDVDSIKAIVYVFEQINDHHSGIFYNGNYYSNFPTFDDTTLDYVRPLLDLLEQNRGKFKGQAINKNYIYLQVPSIQAMGEDISLFAQMLSDTLSKYLTHKTRGIVLDLRLNGGGQFSSMAAGLAPLLGNRYIGGGINGDSVQTMAFKLNNGNLLLNDYQITSITHKVNRNIEQLPVALIIGPITASSGSILAVSFKGRPNTIFVGENTASGYTSGNDYFAFGNNLFLNLSTTNIVDRNNRPHLDVVKPDIVIKGQDNFESIVNDNKVKIALKWLKDNRRL